MFRRFGLSGIFGHWESTATSLIGFAATVGVFNATQAHGCDAVVVALATLISAIASLAKLFYKGPQTTGPKITPTV